MSAAGCVAAWRGVAPALAARDRRRWRCSSFAPAFALASRRARPALAEPRRRRRWWRATVRRRGAPVVAVGYREPSLVFLLGTDTRLPRADAAAECVADGARRGGAGRATARTTVFRQRACARAAGTRARSSTVAGLDYSNGKRMTLDPLSRRAGMSGRRSIGLGVGPGDPELITLKALRLLRAAPVVAYPAPETATASPARIVARWLVAGADRDRHPRADGQRALSGAGRL